MKISVSLVLFNNNIEEILNIVNCFLNSSLVKKIYIVDNSKIDLVSNKLIHEKIIYFHNPENPGFGASHNIAIKYALLENFDYHIVSNVDISFIKGTIEKLTLFMNVNSNVGQVMPKVLSPKNEVQYLCKQNPTVFNLFIRGFVPKSLHYLFNKKIQKYEYLDIGYENIVYNIPYLSGCFMFFRTSSLKDIGFFDENIFMYLEDADITRRMLNKYSTAYYPEASVVHQYAGLTHKKIKYKIITIQSAFIYFSKWGWIKSIY